MASPGDWFVFMIVHIIFWAPIVWFANNMYNGAKNWQPPEYVEERKDKFNEDDFWDEGAIDYDTGEIGSNSRPTVRHPKNADRAYTGGA